MSSERKARRAASAALALSLAAALLYGGYGAWACWLRDRNVFDEFLYGRQADFLPDSLYKGLLSRKWAPEGFCGAEDKLAVKMEDDAREWWLYYCGGEWEGGSIRISLKERTVHFTLSRAVEGLDGATYEVAPYWGYDAGEGALSLEETWYLAQDGSPFGTQISEGEFLEATGWTREDVEEWAEWTMWGFFLPGYFERNGWKSRFSEGDLGELRVEAPWLGGGGDEG
ncbi:hypothetical protein B5F40_14870 [Gordonibacter sp. An230]|uniref:hypothetical protein n=1 Tax=Gordonibacter sp. An230 TaxID=1965592 RepID=UPI000B388A28|nr:hypothetical protein [Gordonibacter sp. An230]OUO86550.1 hypothetical protein B5F40_14870 [Gordonibacter sp. An230]